jgi:hypothetical protein
VSHEFLTQVDLARRWRMSPRTLERWRCLGKGPPYIRIAHVLYRLDDVRAFEAAHIRIGQPVNSESLEAGGDERRRAAACCRGPQMGLQGQTNDR